MGNEGNRPASERFAIEAVPTTSWWGRLAKLAAVALFLADGDEPLPWPRQVRTLVRDRESGRIVFEDVSDASDAAHLEQALARDLQTLGVDVFLSRWT